MTNTEKLKELIEEKGLKYKFIAEQLGITSQSLSNKINGKTDFNVGEIKMMSKILNLSTKMRDFIFLGE